MVVRAFVFPLSTLTIKVEVWVEVPQFVLLYFTYSSAFHGYILGC